MSSIQKTASFSFDNLIQKSMFFDFDNLIVDKKKSSLLNLIKNAQEFDPQCRQIFNQFCEMSERKSSFNLTENNVLKKTDHVFMSQQKTIQN